MEHAGWTRGEKEPTLMYRVSREGRRASGTDNDSENRSARYKERFDNDAYHDKNKGFTPTVVPAGVLPTRHPGVLLCLKTTAALVFIFFVRGVSVFYVHQTRVDHFHAMSLGVYTCRLRRNPGVRLGATGSRQTAMPTRVLCSRTCEALRLCSQLGTE